jgi:magnesium-transporting ATPase (P-type)
MGVEIKILTGDNELVAKKICDDLKVSVKRNKGSSGRDHDLRSDHA